MEDQDESILRQNVNVIKVDTNMSPSLLQKEKTNISTKLKVS